MCGIFLYFSVLKNIQDNIQSLTKATYSIKPRGPENTTTIQSDNYFLSFHRLAIQNTSPECNQPFIYHDTKYSYYVMCNGEIYNYKQLIDKFWLPNVKNDCAVIYPLFVYLMREGYEPDEAFKKLNTIVIENKIISGFLHLGGQDGLENNCKNVHVQCQWNKYYSEVAYLGAGGWVA
jgi:asparagine synthetase B (glutamine-hydrolysing)